MPSKCGRITVRSPRNALLVFAAAFGLALGLTFPVHTQPGNSVTLRNVSGTELATSTNPLRIDPTGSTTQPVSAAALPLPTNASQETGGHLAQIDTDLTKADTDNLRFATPTAGKYTEASISISSSGDNTVVSGTALQTIRVFRLALACASGVNVTFKDGAASSLTGAMPFGGMVLDATGDPWFVTSAGNGFVINLSGAVQCSGKVSYTKS